ncbi:hypothetical protein VCSRO67_1834 [Vibrio cholerae]|nr:hypothetical protein VCSRO67_1834 [Vibrio cholerae]HDB1438729.1 hypothetical protein [Vibrio cholerae]
MMIDSYINTLFKRYKFDELHRVTDEPGIYCWFGSLKIERVDWSRDGEDFVSLVTSIFALYRPSNLIAEVKSNFGLKWNSNLEERSLASWRDAVTNKITSDESIVSSHGVDVVLSSEGNRNIISEFLNVSQEVMASPLYIGKAYSLKKRLLEHKSQIDSLFEVSPKGKDKFYFEGESFAERVYGAGFSAEELIVYTLDIKSICDHFQVNEPSSEDAKKIVLFIEYMLNRMYRPILGKI